ncbi:unnamed protein product [Sympodiomycopsis kandeliae]
MRAVFLPGQPALYRSTPFPRLCRRSLQYLPEAASFVKLCDFLRVMFLVLAENDDFGKDWAAFHQEYDTVWTNATRFVRLKPSQSDEVLTRADLIETRIRHEAQVAPPGTKAWDLAIDINTCRPNGPALTTQLENNVASFVEQ